MAAFFTTLSWALRAKNLVGSLTDAIKAMMATIYFLSNFFVSIKTFWVTLARVAKALVSLILMAAFFTGWELKTTFLKAKTFLAVLSWATNSIFL
jgi:hypothetical protein